MLQTHSIPRYDWDKIFKLIKQKIKNIRRKEGAVNLFSV